MYVHMDEDIDGHMDKHMDGHMDAHIGCTYIYSVVLVMQLLTLEYVGGELYLCFFEYILDI